MTMGLSPYLHNYDVVNAILISLAFQRPSRPSGKVVVSGKLRCPRWKARDPISTHSGLHHPLPGDRRAINGSADLVKTAHSRCVNARA